MGARILDGAAIARDMRRELLPRVADLTTRLGRRPALGIVLAGDNPASEIYVRNKMKAGDEAGLRVELLRLPATAGADEALALVEHLNGRDDVDGILVQAPLPAPFGPAGTRAVFDAIDPAKDVDGFSPVNVGLLTQGRPTLAPCTPSGIIRLLERSGIEVAGANAVVVGRSEIVGKPMALLLLQRDATVTICHSRTRDLAAVCARADILVAAIGRPAFVTADLVKPGATVVDVGINRVAERALAAALFAGFPERLAEFDRRGSAVVGDVHPAVRAVAGAVTPVPGGVGPLTIAMLLANTLEAAERRAARG
jgi:methylenetetrahydrofolate dehydrogenase (NADP+)/methenyltetrahydrofolate cyclohydrolase